MPTLIWLPEALEDIVRLLHFLKDKSTTATQKAAHLIKAGADLLQKQPMIGRLMDDDTERRELFLPFGNSAYVLRYKLDDEKVVIIRVWHGKELRNSQESQAPPPVVAVAGGD